MVGRLAPVLRRNRALDPDPPEPNIDGPLDSALLRFFPPLRLGGLSLPVSPFAMTESATLVGAAFLVVSVERPPKPLELKN